MPKYLTDEKLEISVLVFEIKVTKKAKIFNFLNGRFSIMGGPMDMIFGVFSEINVRLPKSIISHLSQNTAKVVTI